MIFKGIVKSLGNLDYSSFVVAIVLWFNSFLAFLAIELAEGASYLVGIALEVVVVKESIIKHNCLAFINAIVMA